jgi:hypothetical protein
VAVARAMCFFELLKKKKRQPINLCSTVFETGLGVQRFTLMNVEHSREITVLSNFCVLGRPLLDVFERNYTLCGFLQLDQAHAQA